MFISITSQALRRRHTARQGNKKSRGRKLRRLLIGRSRKRLIRYSLWAANVSLLALVIFFVAKSPNTGQAVRQSASINLASSEELAGPLDELSSAEIAVHVSRIAGLPESIEITNNADSIALAESNSSADTSVVAKPLLASSTLITYKDIQAYNTVAGDTVSSVAAKFGVSSDSVRWSNGLNGDNVAVGRTLYLPPNGTNGIVHTVVSGETAESLAARYAADKNLIVSVNDAEVSGLPLGRRILIPGGTVQQVVSSPSPSYNPIGFAWGTSATYGGNAYARGYCTFYVASKVPVGNNWGNADTWAMGARASGWTVSNTPRVGAVAWGAPIRMHVAYVEEVSTDGTMIKFSDMNNLCGWNCVGYSDWIPASYFPGYIYR